ncbi:helix-turn-helix domain-containing protein [Microbacterium marinilacus]|uniref:Helix-turn-helix transcriptional regulator n=1 Tax=Microbacterium marinilacus TaxID=415209 RepID=A0ABP7BDE0_9MICO|nr:AraC family transcriptional regulator [Microbacterium marinilacus]MBY0689003.1 AraC family transcriptional regulator [Microbacterium marinilacus]
MALRALGDVVAENSIRFLGHQTHTHDVPHLVYVVAGSATLEADGERFTLARHEAVWMQASVPHSCQIHDGGMVLGPFLDDHASPGARVHALGVVPALVELMTTALVASPATNEQIEPFREAISDLLRAIGRPRFPVRLPRHPAAVRLAREAVRSTAPLETLAERHHMSARQVQRIFLSEVGLPFSKWRTRARLNGAVAHLVGGGDVHAAARLSGFATRAGLLRALSRETGVPLDRIAQDPRTALAPAA